MTRFLDIFLSCIAIIFLSPFFIIIAIILKLTGEHEVFYFQARVGLHGNPFSLIKFVTMKRGSSALGSITVKDDPRILPVGKFIRKTKINELAQLFNIIMGDMSIVGPRPQVQRCFDAFSEDSKIAIKTVKPGLSGIGSIVFRNEEEILSSGALAQQFYDTEIAPYKGELEQWFVKNNTLSTYLLLIALTIWVIFSPSSKVVYKVFKDLPPIPNSLKKIL